MSTNSSVPSTQRPLSDNTTSDTLPTSLPNHTSPSVFTLPESIQISGFVDIIPPGGGWPPRIVHRCADRTRRLLDVTKGYTGNLYHSLPNGNYGDISERYPSNPGESARSKPPPTWISAKNSFIPADIAPQLRTKAQAEGCDNDDPGQWYLTSVGVGNPDLIGTFKDGDWPLMGYVPCTYTFKPIAKSNLSKFRCRNQRTAFEKVTERVGEIWERRSGRLDKGSGTRDSDTLTES